MCGLCFSLQRAEFEEFVVLRPGNHAASFHDSGPRDNGGRFRERRWPVFWRVRAKPGKRDWARSPCAAKWDRSMHKAFRVETQLRWSPRHPLTRQWDRVDEAIEATRGTRA